MGKLIFKRESSLINQLIFHDYQKEIIQINSEVYSPGESPDSPGGFGFQKTKRINSRALSKNLQKIIFDKIKATAIILP